MNTPRNYEELLQRFTTWAFAQPDIRALILLGSRARPIDHPADEWSDLDLIAFVADLTAYTRNVNWLAQFGPIWLSVLERNSRGDAEWLVMYEGGLKIDVLLAPAREHLDPGPYDVALQYGQQVLFDKTHTLSDDARAPAIVLPNAETFSAQVNKFWLEALRAAKLIRRSDLWRAKASVDGALKQHALTMMEWHTLSIDPARDVWQDGRYLDEWLDRDALNAVPGTFAAYDPIDLWRALQATIDLFRRLAVETAKQLNLAYSYETDRHVGDWLRSVFNRTNVG